MRVDLKSSDSASGIAHQINWFVIFSLLDFIMIIILSDFSFRKFCFYFNSFISLYLPCNIRSIT